MVIIPLSSTNKNPSKLKINILYYMESRSSVGGVANVAYYLPRILDKKVNIIYFPRFKPEPQYFIHLLDIFIKFLRGEFNIVHFNTVPAFINGGFMLLMLAKKFGVKTCLNIHGIMPLEQSIDPVNPLSYGLKLLATIVACKIADRIVVNSKWMRDKVTFWYRVSPRKAVVIPNGVNLKDFSRHIKKPKLDGNPAIISIGRLNNIKGIKGVDILIKAMSMLTLKLSCIKLYIIGSGKLEKYQRLVKNEGLEKHVFFLGEIPRESVIKLLNCCDICIIPSIYEPFGIVVLEALASGTPVIASKTGGIPEIITSGESGLLVKPNNPKALAEAILKLSYDKNLKERLSQKALRTAAKYDWNNIAEKYVQLYQEMINT